jgi:uncharacterized membrane protein YciS (DUF1049 family)
MTNTSEADGRPTGLRALIYLALAVVGLWLGSFFVIVFTVASWEQRAQLGDLFGVINSLFSGLAFAGVIYAIYLQREELSLQRRELQLTREELQRTATAQEHSQKALQKQVEVMETTARLGALASIVEHYRVLIEGSPVAREKLQFQERQRDFVRRLEHLVDEMEGRRVPG